MEEIAEVEEDKGRIVCDVCQGFYTKATKSVHEKTLMHRGIKKADDEYSKGRLSMTDRKAYDRAYNKKYYEKNRDTKHKVRYNCDLCNKSYTYSSKALHLNTKMHKNNLLKAAAANEEVKEIE
ncbi:MAG: hypothetical protein Harvfovirus6_29 [Harvfovirus sp.]|uniref:C2H2-type domain-containing protein n=1 Tax=Harvfovirus sp. TaxID=2487768 RepID=A0A3G5A5L5_9VIRU|nr:MAG: hypothetical protein Harvfovirus6_29 [Harvfovirus sp.]